jgi:hypothetical protein
MPSKINSQIKAQHLPPNALAGARLQRSLYMLISANQRDWPLTGHESAINLISRVKTAYDLDFCCTLDRKECAQ